MELNKAQEYRIKQQQEAYAKARANNDYDGMRNANEAANKIRSEAGVATYDSSKGDAQYAANRNLPTGGTNTKNQPAATKNTGGGGSNGGGARYKIGSNGVAYDDNVDILTQIRNAFSSGQDYDVLKALADQRVAKVSNPIYSKWDTDDVRNEIEYYLQNSPVNQITENTDLLTQAAEDILNYENPFSDDIEEALGKLQNMESFSYDYNTDPLYQIYSTQYAQKGDDAMQDVLAEAAAMTGGLPSSWAMSAAAGAKNQYNQELNNIIPQLEQAAYARYQGDYQRDYDLLSQIANLDSQSYNQFADQMSRGTSIAEYLSNLGYQQERDTVSDNQWQQSYDYQVTRDNVMDAQWLSEFSEAQRQAIVNEAIDNRQISVSEGNLALSRARYGNETVDTSYRTGQLSEMISSSDPMTWIASNSESGVLTDEDVEWLIDQYKKMNSVNDGSSSLWD